VEGVTWCAASARRHGFWSAPAGNRSVALPSYYFGTTDSTGTVELTALLPGPYDVTIGDPRLAELGIGVPAHFSFDATRDSTVVTTIRVPATDFFIGDRCARSPRAALRDSVFLFGRVLTQDGHPVSDAKVTFAPRTAARGSGARIISSPGTTECSNHATTGALVTRCASTCIKPDSPMWW